MKFCMGRAQNAFTASNMIGGTWDERLDVEAQAQPRSILTEVTWTGHTGLFLSPRSDLFQLDNGGVVFQLLSGLCVANSWPR
jgi:hypothetical protein